MGAHKGILLLASGWSLSVFQFQFQSGDSDRNFSSERALAIQRLTPRALHRRTAPGGGLWGAGGLTAPPHTRSGGRTSPPMSAHKHTCTRVHDRPGCRKCKIPREPPAPRRRAPFKPSRARGHAVPPAAAPLKPWAKTFLPGGNELPSLRIFCSAALARKGGSCCTCMLQREQSRGPARSRRRGQQAVPTRRAKAAHTALQGWPTARGGGAGVGGRWGGGGAVHLPICRGGAPSSLRGRTVARKRALAPGRARRERWEVPGGGHGRKPARGALLRRGHGRRRASTFGPPAESAGTPCRRDARLRNVGHSVWV